MDGSFDFSEGFDGFLEWNKSLGRLEGLEGKGTERKEGFGECSEVEEVVGQPESLFFCVFFLEVG